MSRFNQWSCELSLKRIVNSVIIPLNSSGFILLSTSIHYLLKSYANMSLAYVFNNLFKLYKYSNLLLLMKTITNYLPILFCIIHKIIISKLYRAVFIRDIDQTDRPKSVPPSPINKIGLLDKIKINFKIVSKKMNWFWFIASSCI